MNAQRFRQPSGLPLLFFYLLCRAGGAYAASTNDVAREVQDLVARALESNPSVVAARTRAEQAVAEHASVAGFFDPRLTVAGGTRQWGYTLPWSIRAAGLADDALEARLGLEIPLRTGAYLGLGVAERYLPDPDLVDDALYQSVLGAGLWVPIGRDRGFAEWKGRDTVAIENIEAALTRLAIVTQDVRRNVNTAYVEFLRTYADEREAGASIARAEALLADAQELVRLDVVPEYHLFAARLEVSVRREEEQAAKHLNTAALIRLQELVGQDVPLSLEPEQDTLVAWATAYDMQGVPLDPERAFRHRGTRMEIEARIRVAQAEHRLAKEAQKPNIALALSAGWQAENADDLIGRDSVLTEEELGFEAAVVWTQPLGYRTERADTEALRLQTVALDDERREIERRIVAELRTARDAFLSARARMRLVSTAVADASLALAAEEERFQLGEGRSRLVLDAQKDLSAAARRRNNAAAALLGAYAEFRYATGYAPDLPLSTTPTPEGGETR